MASLASNAFRSVKLRRNSNPNPKSATPTDLSKSRFSSFSFPPPEEPPKSNPVLSLDVNTDQISSSSKSRRRWTVYLILSTNHPIKTYVGVTTDFSRRLKQHNGQVKGGAKAARAGRPWISACIVRGFKDRSEACKFESKWKSVSRSLPGAKKNENDAAKEIERASLQLLQRREAAMNRMQTCFDFSLLDIDWQLNRLANTVLKKGYSGADRNGASSLFNPHTNFFSETS